jgi:hypothetical protein
VVDREILATHAAVLAGVVVTRQNRMARKAQLGHGTFHHVPHLENGWGANFTVGGEDRLIPLLKDFGLTQNHQTQGAAQTAYIEGLVI